MSNWNIVEITALVNAAKDANLTPRQAIAALYYYRPNKPTKSISRYKIDGRIEDLIIRGADNKYRNK
jgi:hypothetical protein